MAFHPGYYSDFRAQDLSERVMEIGGLLTVVVSVSDETSQAALDLAASVNPAPTVVNFEQGVPEEGVGLDYLKNQVGFDRATRLGIILLSDETTAEEKIIAKAVAQELGSIGIKAKLLPINDPTRTPPRASLV